MELTRDQKPQEPPGAVPRVSVIIPAYNAAPHIAEALDSVFQQTFRDFEVIVVNDGSPDTPQLEAALAPYLDRILYIKQENRGSAGARNAGILASRGELLAFLDSDDLWLPGYLEAQVGFLDRYPQVVASITDVLRFGEMAQQESVRRMCAGSTPRFIGFEQLLRREAGQLPSATVVRRARAFKAGLFDERFRRAEDISFLYSLIFPDGYVGYLGQTLAKYRRHRSSKTGLFGYLDTIRSEAEFLQRVGRDLPLSPAQRTLLNQEIAAVNAEIAMAEAYHAISKQKFHEAAICMRRANAHYRDWRITVLLGAIKILPHWTARVVLARRIAKYSESVFD
jgi:glycosyltransferase involved in cell wall biosynthesis